MAERTIVDKAGEVVGIGMEMATEVAGAIKTAIGAAATTVTGVPKRLDCQPSGLGRETASAPLSCRYICGYLAYLKFIYY